MTTLEEKETRCVCCEYGCCLLKLRDEDGDVDEGNYWIPHPCCCICMGLGMTFTCCVCCGMCGWLMKETPERDEFVLKYGWCFLYPWDAEKLKENLTESSGKSENLDGKNVKRAPKVMKE